jgi:hypothetical protein
MIPVQRPRLPDEMRRAASPLFDRRRMRRELHRYWMGQIAIGTPAKTVGPSAALAVPRTTASHIGAAAGTCGPATTAQAELVQRHLGRRNAVPMRAGSTASMSRRTGAPL